jgi:cytochrome P450
MQPVLGPSSVLVLDGPEHIRQRKLLLPPFHSSRVATFRSVIREVAEREVSSWRPGTRIVVCERMQTLTFEVFCRAVFGVTEQERRFRSRRNADVRPVHGDVTGAGVGDTAGCSPQQKRSGQAIGKRVPVLRRPARLRLRHDQSLPGLRSPALGGLERSASHLNGRTARWRSHPGL